MQFCVDELIQEINLFSLFFSFIIAAISLFNKLKKLVMSMIFISQTTQTDMPLNSLRIGHQFRIVTILHKNQ